MPAGPLQHLPSYPGRSLRAFQHRHLASVAVRSSRRWFPSRYRGISSSVVGSFRSSPSQVELRPEVRRPLNQLQRNRKDCSLQGATSRPLSPRERPNGGESVLLENLPKHPRQLPIRRFRAIRFASNEHRFREVHSSLESSNVPPKLPMESPRSSSPQVRAA